jgi:hypothetical protein
VAHLKPQERVPLDKNEGVVKRHYCIGMLSSTAWISERWRTLSETLKGWPDQIGETSLAAFSQTVTTRFISGAPGLQTGPTFASRSLRWQAGKLQLFQSFWPHYTGWKASRAVPVKCGLCFPFKIPSAMIDRAELPVQRNKTL